VLEDEADDNGSPEPGPSGDIPTELNETPNPEEGSDG
jgi:hypothetical protein